MSEIDLSTSLSGVYDHSVFCSEETGWTVGVLNVNGGPRPATIVGMFTAVPGETLTLRGRWSHNRKFGEQFEVQSCEATAPATLDGLRKYLSSGMIKGIGPVYAERLVERFGLEVPSVIEHNPRRLFEIPGIGRKRQGQIVSGWDSQKEIKNIMLFLQSHHVGTAYAVKIFRLYGNQSISVVSHNPYRLAEDISGIGFKTADEIAASLGIAKGSEERMHAALLYSLQQFADREGHILVPGTLLIERASALIEISADLLGSALHRLLSKESSPLVRDKLVVEAANPAPFIEEEAVYLSFLHRAETASSERLKEILATPAPELRPVAWDRFFKWYHEKFALDFSPLQQSAIQTAYESKITIITGGPGTGKSTLIKSLTTLLSRLGSRFLLSSPTGRAAKRMTEITGLEARTIHRLLEFDPKTNSFKRNRSAPLDCELLIVDETSMIDCPLLFRLLEAVPPTSRLVLVGDADQLPSVGPGNCLRDLIASGCFKVVTLTEIFRQAAHSLIVRSAHRINQGLSLFEENDSAQLLSPPADPPMVNDFFFMERNSPEAALDLIVQLCRERLPRKYGLNPLRDIQLVSPMKKGVVGTINLNRELQNALNPQGVFLERNGKRFGEGDRVIQIRNNYDLEVFNGDIGYVSRVNVEDRELAVRFEGREVSYGASDLDELDLAYAISIHKAQGSEFAAVIIPCVPQHTVMLQRNLLYTAVTRGKKLVVLVGSRASVILAIRNAQMKRRFTALSQRLREGN